MRDLYIILSVVGWAWCLLVAALLWVRLRNVSEGKRAAVASRRHGRPRGPGSV